MRQTALRYPSNLLCAAIVLATVAGCAARRQPSAAPPPPVDAAVVDLSAPDAAIPDAALPVTVPIGARARPLVPAALDGWRGRLGDRLKAAGAVGWASAVVVGPRIVEAHAVGRTVGPAPAPLTTGTARPLGTLSRVVTGLLIAALIEEGHLDWSAPVTRLRRDWSGSAQTPTVAEMACGCFGIAAVPGTPPKTAAQVLERLRGHLEAGDTLEAMPTPVLASAAGYLAALGAPSSPIEPGAAYVAQVQQRVTGPLGMGWTVGAPDAPGIVPVFAPDAGGWASLDDIGRMAVALVAGGSTPSGGRVVEGAAITRGLAVFDGQSGPSTRLGLRIEPRGSLGLRIGGGPVGGGITRLVVADDLAWVIRVEGAGPAVEEALAEALDALLTHRYRLSASEAPAASAGTEQPVAEQPAAEQPSLDGGIAPAVRSTDAAAGDAAVDGG